MDKAISMAWNYVCAHTRNVCVCHFLLCTISEFLEKFFEIPPHFLVQSMNFFNFPFQILLTTYKFKPFFYSAPVVERVRSVSRARRRGARLRS